MSMVALICNCASAPNLVRQFLVSQHHPDPFSVRLYKGPEAKSFAEHNHLSDISAYLSARSSYALLVGWGSPENVHWADINHNLPDQIIKAEAIVKRFA